MGAITVYTLLLVRAFLEGIIFDPAAELPVRFCARAVPHLRDWLERNETERPSSYWETLMDLVAAAALASILAAGIDVAYNSVNKPRLVRLFACVLRRL